MLQVIPFAAEQEPFFLGMLARGLTDLATLRFNGMEIPAQVNRSLKFVMPSPEIPLADSNWEEGQDLWLCGSLYGGEMEHSPELSMSLILFAPRMNRPVYRTSFQAKEEVFLEKWEDQLFQLVCFLRHDIALETSHRKMFTKSLEAFLSFRKGLEVISEARNDQVREEGLESLLKAVAYDPGFTEAADILILFLMQNGTIQDFEKIIMILENLREISGINPRIPMVLADVYNQQGNQQKAEQLLREVTTAFPHYTEGWLRLAVFYHAQNQSQQALETLQSLIDFMPDEPTALDLMAAIYASLGQREQAEMLWQKVLNLDSQRINVLNNLGLLAEEEGLAEKAESYYKQSVLTNETWWGSFFHYGSFCLHHDRLEEAAVLLKKADELNQDHFPTLQNLGMAYIQLGKYEEAQETLLKLLQIASDNQSRRQTLQLLDHLQSTEIKIETRIRRLEKTWDEGKKIPVLWEIMRLWLSAGQRWYFWYLCGHICESFRLQWTASRFWLHGLRYDPGFQLFRSLGLYYWQKGRYAKALPLLRKAYLLNQSAQDTAQAYLQTMVSLGNTEELHVNLNELAQFDSKYGSFAKSHLNKGDGM